MQIGDIPSIPELSTEMFILLSITSLVIGLCTIIFGLVRQKRHQKSTLATGCIVFGTLVIISHTIQIVVRVLWRKILFLNLEISLKADR